MEKSGRRARAVGIQYVLLATLGGATLLAGGCSDDEAAPKAGASGGEGGEPQAGGSGAAPGAAGSGEQAGEGNGARAGEGGVAGMPAVVTAGEECTVCGAVECKGELDACSGNPECEPWLACLTACDDEACIDSCDATHEAASRVYYGIYDCLCGQCEDACAASQACDKQCVDDAALPNDESAPATLAETGLYAGYELGGGGAGGAGGAPSLEPDTELLTLASYVQRFEPKYPLWSDGAEKERHIYIPKCSSIDNSDPDHWEFPVGTRLWKRFTVPGPADGTRVETRFMHHYGPGEADWTFASYQWDVDAPDDPAAAVLADAAGVLSVNGTSHDIPGVDQCQNCHTRVSERVLGFGSFQLSHDTSGSDLTIAKISRLGWLTQPAPAGFEVPGTAVQQAALGYLHGNCGSCHNPSQQLGAGLPNDNTPLMLRLAVGQTVYEETDIVTSSVGVIVGSGMAAITGKPRIDPMAPTNSALLLRMEDRGTALQMPPLVTRSSKLADPMGVSAVTAWVDSLQP